MSRPQAPGVTVFLTGLSGAGKSTIADALVAQLEAEGRPVTVLDGDVVRTHLSSELTFSREHRDLNIARIGWVAGEIVRHGGVAICAAVSPYRSTRAEARRMIGADRFIEVFVDTPLEVCEARDAKGMYAQARQGLIRGFTGVDDPYEAPLEAEVTLDTVRLSAVENAERIVGLLQQRGFVREEREAQRDHVLSS
jgi:sulfate adenylyltransferase